MFTKFDDDAEVSDAVVIQLATNCCRIGPNDGINFAVNLDLPDSARQIGRCEFDILRKLGGRAWHRHHECERHFVVRQKNGIAELCRDATATGGRPVHPNALVGIVENRDLDRPFLAGVQLT